MSKYMINSTYFDLLHTPEQSYVLGFLWADGHVRKDGYAVCIKVNKRDRDIVEFIRDQLGSNHKITSTSHDRVVLSLNSKKLNTALRELGFTHNKTYSDHVPLCGSDQLAFIRGLIDGDGSIWNSRSQWSLQVTGNQAICKFLYGYFQRGGVYKDHSVYKWQIGGAQQMKNIAIDLLACRGNLPQTRKVELLQQIVQEVSNG
jgi:hypothetical protein